jgi:hypothetical protein
MLATRVLVLAALLLTGAGCSTIGDLTGEGESSLILGTPGPHIMGGFRTDIVALGGGNDAVRMAAPLWIFDTPWSLALDIVVLPFTVPYVLLTDPKPPPPPPKPD